MRELINNGANVNVQGYRNIIGANMRALGYSKTPLHHAVLSELTEIVQLLIHSGANVNALCGIANTPLYFSTLTTNPEIVQLLVNNGAHVNTDNYDRRTPLHGAAMGGNTEMGQLLIHNGADFNTPDNSKRSPYQEAQEQGLTDITTLCNRINSLQNNDIDNVITDDTSRKDRIYYAQAMIAYGYYDVAHRIISKHFNKLSDKEYANIMIHAIRHRNNKTACNQFITHVRNIYENNNKAQAVVNKAWNNVRNSHISPHVITWMLDNYEYQCSDFRDDNHNTILHIAATDKRLNPYLPHIATYATQNQNNSEYNDDGETPEMIAYEYSNYPGQSIIYNIGRLNTELSNTICLSQPSPRLTTGESSQAATSSTSELGKCKRQSSSVNDGEHATKYLKRQYYLSPEIRNYIITYIPSEEFPDYFHNEETQETNNISN